MSGVGGRRAGFTLIELLLVIIILAAIAGAAVASLETATGDARIRDEDTRNRLERLRSAILGPEGAATPQGFVADVGRLPYLAGQPSGLTELVVNPNGVAGWRGPYLRTLPGAGGALELPDGWGNSVAEGASVHDQNSFGWHLERIDDSTEADAYNAAHPEVATAPVTSGDLFIQTRGSGVPGDGSTNSTIFPLIRRDDYQVVVAGSRLRVTLRIDAGSPDEGEAPSVCFLHFPGPAGESFTARGDRVGAAALVPGDNILEFEFVDASDPDAATALVERAPIGRRRVQIPVSPVTAGNSRAFEADVDLLPRVPLPAVRTSRVIEVGP